MVSSRLLWVCHGGATFVSSRPLWIHHSLYDFLLYNWLYSITASMVSSRRGLHSFIRAPFAITAPLFHREDISMVYYRHASIVSFQRPFYSLSQRRLDSFIMFPRFHCGKASLASWRRCLYSFITETSHGASGRCLHGFITVSMVSSQPPRFHYRAISTVSSQRCLNGFIMETPPWFHPCQKNGFITNFMVSSWSPWLHHEAPP